MTYTSFNKCLLSFGTVFCRAPRRPNLHVLNGTDQRTSTLAHSIKAIRVSNHKWWTLSGKCISELILIFCATGTGTATYKRKLIIDESDRKTSQHRSGWKCSDISFFELACDCDVMSHTDERDRAQMSETDMNGTNDAKMKYISRPNRRPFIICHTRIKVWSICNPSETLLLCRNNNVNHIARCGCVRNCDRVPLRAHTSGGQQTKHRKNHWNYVSEIKISTN